MAIVEWLFAATAPSSVSGKPTAPAAAPADSAPAGDVVWLLPLAALPVGDDDAPALRLCWALR